jgi:antitoxin HicB
MDYVYVAKIEPDPDGGFLVTFPDVPEAITAGSTGADARANAVEALGLALRGILAEGRPLPRGKAAGKGLVGIAVAASDAMKLALIEAFRESGLSKSEFARRLNKAENEARRILDPDHPTKLSTMQEALSLLGKSVIVSVRDAA